MPVIVIYAAIASGLFVGERLRPLHRQRVLRRGFLVDAGYVGLHYLLRVFLNGTLALALTAVASQVLPDPVIGVLEGRPLGVEVAAVVVVLDFIFYWTHR